MADKKSFVSYTDNIDFIEELSDEEAGILMKSIYRFADSDGEYEFKTENRVLKTAYIVITNQIKRDSEKYELKKLKNAEYYKNKKVNSENSVTEKTENSKKEIQNFKELKKLKNYSENSESDNDSDSVSVNDSVSVSESVNDNGCSFENCTPDTLALTNQERESLVDDYGEDVIEDYINRVQHYCTEHNKTYKDYALTIRTWLNRDGVKKRDNHLDIYNSGINDFDISEFEEVS